MEARYGTELILSPCAEGSMSSHPQGVGYKLMLCPATVTANQTDFNLKINKNPTLPSHASSSIIKTRCHEIDLFLQLLKSELLILLHHSIKLFSPESLMTTILECAKHP